MLIYPRDSVAGGTWIGANERGWAAVLLNGGYEPHKSRPPYRHSRGLIIPLVLSAVDSQSVIRIIDLSGIEPFTLILFGSGTLMELVWDGRSRHLSLPDASLPHIWSSVTLYAPHARDQRQRWFAKWLENRNDINLNDVLHFHKTAGSGDPGNDLLMRREGVATVSVTSLRMDTSGVQMKYVDVGRKTEASVFHPFISTCV